MKETELQRRVADQLIVLHVELGRLADARLAGSIRDDAAPYVASLHSWSTSRPTLPEASAVLLAVDRLVARLESARYSERVTWSRLEMPSATL
jgi:hypothetical protein